MPRVINLASGRSPPPTRQRQPPRPIQRTKCQQNPDSIECLEEQLSALRSSPVAVRRSGNPNIPYDPQIAFPLASGGMGVLNIIGGQTQALEQQIKKNEMI